MGPLARLRRDLRTLASLPLPELVASLWRLLRPAFWIVTIFPVYLGYVYAAGELFPVQALWVDLWRDALAGGVGLGDVWATLRTWLGFEAARDFVYALLVLGPFIWGGTLLYNDVQDLDADRDKAMRAESPLVKGYLSPTTALGVVYVLSAVGMALSWLVSPTFFALMAAALVLSWAYSAPPLHLKARPGWDVAVNVVGVGVLCFLGGYSLARPLADFPIYLLLPAVLTLAAVYLPTVIADYHVDRRFGVATTAVAYGPRRAFRAGFAALVLADLSLVAIGLWTDFIPLAYFALTWPLFVLKDVLYAVLIGRVDHVASIWAGIAAVGALTGILNVVFLLVLTGFWVV